MGKDSKIQWTDHTFNHVRGCTKVSPGCAHCYAEKLSHRNPAVLGEWGPGKPRVRAGAAMWREPVKWNKDAPWFAECPKCGWRGALPTICPAAGCNAFGSEMGSARPRVFCASLADWLDDADVRMPDGRIDRGGLETLADLLDLWRRCENLDILALTKRIENWRPRLEQVFEFINRGPLSGAATWAWLADWLDGRAAPNVWLGVSAENQEYWDKRVPVLLSIPAARRFVSVEPMLGPINMESGLEQFHTLDPMMNRNPAPIHWVIFGGESGPRARPCNVDWIRDGVRQCKEAGVATFVKQDSGRLPGLQGRIDDETWKVKEWPNA